MEYYFKSMLYGNGVSAVPPKDYTQRFVNFIDDFIFKKYDNTTQLIRTPISYSKSPGKQEVVERMRPKRPS